MQAEAVVTALETVTSRFNGYISYKRLKKLWRIGFSGRLTNPEPPVTRCVPVFPNSDPGH